MPVLQDNAFYCDHLGASENDARDILSFSVQDDRGEGLVNYLQKFAFPDEENGTMRTYLVRNNLTSELVGYFSLKAGLVSFNEMKTETGAVFDILPGIELANFAVNSEYVSNHPKSKGVGAIIFKHLIVPLVHDVAGRVGVKVLYIFALPFEGLIRRYTQYEFMRLEAGHEADVHNRLKPRYDEGCVFMYQMLQINNQLGTPQEAKR